MKRITAKGHDNVKKFLLLILNLFIQKNKLDIKKFWTILKRLLRLLLLHIIYLKRKNNLVSALTKVGEHRVVNIITNIPSRWETYYGDTLQNKARQQINVYLLKLKPESLGINSKVFFDFSNYGKIITTDCIVYVGSVNYSEESANYTEFGFILRNKD